MRQVVEATGTVPPDVDLPSVVFPAADWVRDRVAEIVRSDRRWKLAEPLTVTIADAATRAYRVHCTLDTEAGDVPILPGDPVPGPDPEEI